MTALTALVTDEVSQPVDPQVSLLAQHLADQYGTASRAVLFYGSCLREQQLDGLMLDFYLIVSDYPSAYQKRWLRAANRLIPPNVFPFAAGGLAAKYAVLSEADFAALNQAGASSVSVWARFAQPTRLVWSADDAARTRAIEAVSQAAPTLLSLARPLVPNSQALDAWRVGFAQTYKAELRAERTDRSGSIVDADPARYAQFSAAVPSAAFPLSAASAQARWKKLQRHGKWLSVLRLAKASLTFSGGIDYLAWKINRHAGTKIEIRPWQRRWPLIAALTLVPKLMRSGAVR
jgi:hypothetical protein